MGLDYLLKPHWDDLDILTKHNYYGRHDKRLINRLFEVVKIALNNSILEMKKSCKKGPGLNNWIEKTKKIINLGKFSEKENKKVIFIDTVTQFLREITTSPCKKINKKIAQGVVKSQIRKELKGLVASTAKKKIKEYARIIFRKNDFFRFKTGEILITQETDSSFLPIIKNAKGIITDKGGLLCHAAIVARELKKPCIVGVKYATKIIKNGDLIEMNLESGEIKILN